MAPEVLFEQSMPKGISKQTSQATILIAGILAIAWGGCSNAQRAGGTGGRPSGPGGSGGTSTDGALGGSDGSGGGGPSATGGRTGSGGTSASGGSTGSGGGPAGSGGQTSGGGQAGSAPGGRGPTGGAPGSGGNPDAAIPPEDAASDLPADGGVPTDGSTPDSAPQTCAGSQTVPKAGDTTVTVQSGGRSRSYIRHVPSGLASGTALPVVIDLHGAGGTGKQQQGLSGFNALADKEKFLAIFPDGVDGYWNVDDTCCGTAGKQKIDDVGFLKAIITKLSAETCVDAKRIYVSGFSNGGGLAHRMGCDAADVIAAIAPAATDLRTQPCNAARPISMIEVRSVADSLEPYGGGLVGPAGGQYVAVGAKASQKLWADIDKCTGGTTTADKYCENFTQCANGVEVDLCSLPNTDHNPYSNSLGFNVATVAWRLFARQAMR